MISAFSAAKTIALSMILLSVVTLSGSGISELIQGGTKVAFAGTFPGDNGQIAFRRSIFSDTEVFLVNSTLDLTNLSNSPTTPEPSRPSWSPDGTMIAFASTRSSNPDIYVINADGTGLTRITTNVADDTDPSWSPDGTKIAFASNRNGLGYKIYSIEFGGSDPADVDLISNHLGFAIQTSWSPDGTKIVFQGTNNTGNFDIYAMNAADGSGFARLTDDIAQDTLPSWSPDGTKIAFTSGRTDADATTDTDIYVMDANGDNEVILDTDVTENPALSDNPAAIDTAPSWSPDGTKIAFGSNRDGLVDIYTVNIDGSGLTRITEDFSQDGVPDWGPNQAPIADAGPDQVVDEGSPVSLDGSQSVDKDGWIGSYSWIQTSGAAVTLDDNTVSTPSFTAPSVPSAGDTLTFELTVTDNQGAIDADTVNIEVLNVNVLPTADAGADSSAPEGTIGLQLNGGASSDSDGFIASYLWAQTSGPSVDLIDANLATATFDAPSVATTTNLTFELTVTDNDGGTATDGVTVSVQNVNQGPVANAGSDFAVDEGVLAVALDGSASNDPDDPPLAGFEWAQISGTAVSLTGANSATPTFDAPTVEADTELTFELTVTDSDAATAMDQVVVTIKQVNQSPTSSLTASLLTIDEGGSSNLDASASTDPDALDSLTYSFLILSGGPGTITGQDNPSDPTVTYEAPSDVSSDLTVTIEVTVDDGNGGTDSTTLDIQVLDFPPPPLYTILGFNAPVDNPPIVNTIKSGKSVALSFEVFDNSNIEQTSTSVIQSFTRTVIDCNTISGNPQDAIETMNSRKTSLKYDTGLGTFIQNWKTPRMAAGSCYSVSIMTIDGSSISAYFRLV